MKKLALFTAALLFAISTFATHNMGGDISYAHLSGNTYRFTVRTFTNTSNTNADRCELELHVGTDSVVLPRINGVSTLCPSGHDGEMICTTVNYNLYQADFTVNATGLIPFYVSDPNRTASICNVNNGSSVNTLFQLSGEMIVDATLGYNSAPQYPALALVANNVGVISTYNPHVINTEADSLYFDFMLPAGITLPPASNSVTINHQTGEIIWDAPNTICNYIFDVQLKEFRNIGGTYYYLGSTMQEIYTYPCSYNMAVAEVARENQFSVYPNPAANLINIEGAKAGMFSAELFNVLGERVNYRTVKQSNSLSIDVSEFSKGVYFLQITDENNYRTTQKVVIQ